MTGLWSRTRECCILLSLLLVVCCTCTVNSTWHTVRRSSEYRTPVCDLSSVIVDQSCLRCRVDVYCGARVLSQFITVQWIFLVFFRRKYLHAESGTFEFSTHYWPEHIRSLQSIVRVRVGPSRKPTSSFREALPTP